MALTMARKLITVIVPVLNEAATLNGLIDRLSPVLDGLAVRWEVLFVDDGSTDETLAVLKAFNSRDRRITAISLSRNFGKEIALAAGLKYAQGDAVILMDADLQHPPELLALFVDRWREGYQIVYGQRLEHTADGPLRRFFSRAYYKIFNALANTDIPEGAGDFRLLDRCAIDAMNRIGEVSRFNKGLFSWIGFRTVGVPYTAAVRTSGISKWSYRRLARFALDGLTSFSTLPLRVFSLLGLAISLSAFAYALIVLAQTLVLGVDVPGYPSLIISVMFFAGVQLISLGVIGEYLGRVYEEVKARPLFIVSEEIGLSQGAAAPAVRAVPAAAGAKEHM